MTIIAAIRKFLRLDNEVISLDYALINSTGLMIEDSKDFMHLPLDGCIELVHPLDYNGDILLINHINDVGNC